MEEMTLREYQQRAMETCMDTCRNDLYMLFELSSEVGELHGKIAKAIRKGVICSNETNDLPYTSIPSTTDYADYEAFYEGLKGEIGDILWGIAGICSVLSFDLEDVARGNLAKLASRKQRGVIDGEGDNR